ncbi:PH domain-containing protein [Fusobacterium mortiferum]|jgi:hypothetical protein|uniref:PH domain-containing protein n=1 Tax=Fusobacterium mortiferum TaxID=850 RepID=UPI003F91CAE5
MTYEEIQKRLKELGQIDMFGTKKEVKELPNIMYAGETLEYLMSGFMNGNTWLIVCTNKRILFLDKGLIFGCKQLEIPLDKVNSVETSKGLLLGSIKVWDGASAMKIDNVQKFALQPFVTAVNNAREALKNNNQQIKVEKNNDTNDYIKELEKLAELKEKGIITEDEFLSKKKQLLGL